MPHRQPLRRAHFRANRLTNNYVTGTQLSVSPFFWEGKQEGMPNNKTPDWRPRLARGEDIPAVEVLIPISVRELQTAHYSTAQMDAAIGSIFGVDRQLIRDQTYFVVE